MAFPASADAISSCALAAEAEYVAFSAAVVASATVVASSASRVAVFAVAVAGATDAALIVAVSSTHAAYASVARRATYEFCRIRG